MVTPVSIRFRRAEVLDQLRGARPIEGGGQRPKGLFGGDVPADDRIPRAADLFGLTPQLVSAALDYYAMFTEEIDHEIAENLAVADAAEATWRRRQELLTG